MRNLFISLFLTFALVSCKEGQLIDDASVIGASRELAENEQDSGEVPLNNKKTQRKDETLNEAPVSVITQVGASSQFRVLVELVIKNPTQQAFEICKYHSPFDASLDSSRAFSIIDSRGMKLPYSGRVVKKGPPTRLRGDFIVIDAGESVTAEINLAKYYQFKPGVFKIQFKGSELNKIPTSDIILVEL